MSTEPHPEAADISPADRVTVAEQALARSQRAVEEAQAAHQQASSEYVNALRAFHKAYAVDVAQQAAPSLPPRLPTGRDDEQA